MSALMYKHPCLNSHKKKNYKYKQLSKRKRGHQNHINSINSMDKEKREE